MRGSPGISPGPKMLNQAPRHVNKTILLATLSPESPPTRLHASLKGSGHAVVTSSFDALQASLEDALPDLILIDALENSERALSVCSSIRRRCERDSIPIVLLRDAAPVSWTEQACAAGATEFLDSGMPSGLLERRLDGAIAHMNRLLNDTLIGANSLDPSGAAREIAEPSVFPRLVSVAIDHCRTTDNNVCVLVISVGGDPALKPEFSDSFANLLGLAVREFEQDGPISHPKGHVVISRISACAFALLVPDLGRIQDAARLGYKIQESAQRSEGASPYQVSVGISTSPGDSNNGLDLLHQAQEASNLAQHDEGGGLNFRTESTNRWVFERLTLERSLRSAIENDELVVFYQPKVSISGRDLIGFEALVRWQHPQLGMVSPAQFIPLAEETGLIVPIGEWVMETACAQAQAWTNAGHPPIRMAVNLSPVQFRKANLCDVVAEILQRTGLPPSRLELEVTESMLMHSLKDTIHTLQRLKATGIYLSIDDFGTGYSSLSYLKGFPIDALKIDRSFVRDITANADDAAIATSIILMGRSLNLNVIAEGVETENQRAFLEVLQCNEFQGYLMSPPVPAEKAEAFLTPAS